MSQNLLSAAVVIGALRVKFLFNHAFTAMLSSGARGPIFGCASREDSEEPAQMSRLSRVFIAHIRKLTQ